jgi:iron complex outermembrane receptor protein
MRVAAGLVLLLSVSPLLAQEETPPPVVSEEIVVTAPKAPVPLDEVPAAVTVLTRQEIEQRPASTLGEALAATPGLHVYDLSGTGTEAVADLRGFYSAGETSYLLLLVDGVAAGDLETDAVDWSLVDLEQVERVEVLRGPVSTLYGSAMGGLVNVVTRRPERGTSGRVALHGGEHGTAGGTASLGFAGGARDGTLFARRQEVEGWRAHSAWSVSQLRGVLRLGAGEETPRRTSFAWRASLSEVERERPGPLPEGAPRDLASTPLDRDDARSWDTGLSLEVPLGERSYLEVFAAVREEDGDVVETILFQPLGHDPDSRIWGGELRWRGETAVAGRTARLRLGSQAERGRLDDAYHAVDEAGARSGRINAGRTERTSLAAFGVGEVDLTEYLALSLGVRHDRIRGEREERLETGRADSRHSATSPSIALNRRLGESGNVYLSVSRSFKAPTLEQLYDRRPFFLGPDLPPITLSNAGLDPQRAWSYEAGARTRLGRSAWTEAALYHMRVTDEIGFDLANLHFANIDRSLHRGFEWGLTAHLVDLRPRLAYTLTDATFDGGRFDGKRINGIPRHQIAAALGWTAPRGLSAEIEARHVRGQFADEENRFPIDPYTLLDAAAGLRLSRFELGITVRNLLDARFETSGFVSLDETGGPLPLFYPGAERAVLGRVSFNF